MSSLPDFVQTDDKSLIRDTRSKALLSTDTDGLARNRAQRLKARSHDSLKHQFATLQGEVAELKELVAQLLKR